MNQRYSVLLFLVLAMLAAVYAQTWSQESPNKVDTDSATAAGDESKQPSGDKPSSSNADQKSASSEYYTKVVYPLVILVVGIAVVLGLIIVLKVNAFIALITAAITVSLLAVGVLGEGSWAGSIGRVASAFGSATGNIGIVIAMAAVIGKCMLDSGAADRIVRAFLRLLGEKGAPVALMGSGFVLAVPVFFDTVFYLLVPLARSLYRRTGRNYLMYILAIGAGGAITHTLVPPTPGPLMMASNLGFDVGWMIIVGTIVALPPAIVGVVFAKFADRILKVPMRKIGSEPEPQPLKDEELPSLFVSLLPVVLPVILIATNTVLSTIADNEHAALLKVNDVQDWPAFRTQLREQSAAQADSPGKRIVEVVSKGGAKEAESRAKVVALIQQSTPLNDAQKKELIDGLNKYILPNKQFHRGDEERAFLGVFVNKVARNQLSQSRLRMSQADVERMNRALLESAYPDLIKSHTWETPRRKAANISSLFGDANLALLISTVIALLMVVKQRNLSRVEMAQVVESSLMSGGVIILITAAGGAFGAMLQVAKIGDAIQTLFEGSLGGGSGGIALLVLAFAIGSMLKIAQGSGTVSMIVGTSMMAAIIGSSDLAFHPVYLACAVGSGSLVCSWMNDSGFWIFAKMGGLTEAEALKSWTLMLVVLGFVSLSMTLLMSQLLPLAA